MRSLGTIVPAIKAQTRQKAPPALVREEGWGILAELEPRQPLLIAADLRAFGFSVASDGESQAARSAVA